MPLLKRRVFEKSSSCDFLDGEEEVFHCEITDEIFKDYEEYCERIILVNSMVWSCEMTGKPNLTYAEALESERKARKSLRDFPMELRVPMLYLASRTKRCTFAEMSDDVFNFVRNRYFVGETAEACLDGETWCESHILSVTAPESRNSAASDPNEPFKSPSLYTYEVEQFEEDEEGEEQGQIAIVTCDRIRRSRGVFTKEKNKLYLKQFVEQSPGGAVQIKESVLQKLNIHKVKFDQIFCGDPPKFPSSKKFEKIVNNGSFNKGKFASPDSAKKLSQEKKSRQETISKYMTKVEGVKQSKSSDDKYNNFEWKNKMQKRDSSDGKSLKVEMERVGNAMKQRKIEEKQKKKEKNLKLAAYVKEWSRQKDDLELEDHKLLPKTYPVEMPGVPNKYFGEFMAILEFMLEFSKPIKMRDFFLHGVDSELLRRALTVKEVAGPLSDIIQMLLSALFSLQEEEAEEYNEGRNVHYLNAIKDDPDNSGEMTMIRGVQLATSASKWSQTYLATPLSQLPMDSQTYSEVLRLHLLSSGSGAGEYCTKWRFQQRGGYNSQDDPGLLLKIKEPHVVKALSSKHVTQLPLSYKIKIINCLISQILTYATIRDIIEEQQEKSRNIKNEIRTLQITERRREADFLITRAKIKREAAAKRDVEKLTGEKLKAWESSVANSLENLKKESDSKKAEFEKKYKNLHSNSFSYQCYLGSDRAHRRYWIYESIEGLFLEHSDEFSGKCLDKPVIPNPTLATAPPEDALSYVQRMFESEIHGGASDKENDSDNSNLKKSQGDLIDRSLPESKLSQIQDLLMCTANSSNCPVHSSSYPKTRWSFISSAEDFENLINSLNKRGVREGDLKQLLEQEKDQISRYITKCPTSLLNPTIYPPVGRLEVQTRLTRKYADANLRFPPNTDTSEVLEMTLRDTVLDFEEKLHLSGLGELKDRNIWRDTMLSRGYDKQCLSLTWGPKSNKTEDKAKSENSTDSAIASYRDPGSYLGTSDEINSDIEEELLEDNSVVDINSVKSLAAALLQLGQAVFHKHLKKPLGFDEKERSKDKNLEFNALKRWELSLMESTSYAQVTLHLIVLENSIVWSRSILNANCRICRKKTDDENMLLCDSCNKGHHIYCLKPKLTKIPKGDWFCNQCKPKEKSPQKKNRKVFKEEDSADEDDEESRNSWSSSSSIPLCTACRSGGTLVHCNDCSKGWHSECLPRPQQRKGTFVCANCCKQSKLDKEWDPRVRRCAADAMNNIDHYKKMLKHSPRQYSESESSEEPLIAKARKKRLSKGSSPEIDGSTNKRPKRTRRSAPVTNGNAYNSESSDEPISSLRSNRVSKEAYENLNGGITKKSTRYSEGSKRSSSTTNGYFNGTTRKSRRSETIHSSSLTELLHDVMHHKDSWPFNAPVTIKEVPDYFEIITDPMDFGTIKEKLDSGKYSSDAQFMLDAGLVFSNCYRYNQDGDIVANAGVRLQKYFEKRCKELNLIPMTIEDDDDDQPQNKKNKLEN